MATALDSFDPSVVNGALALLGQPPIAALTDDVTAVRQARDLIVPTLDALLAEHSWNFAEIAFGPAANPATADPDGFFAFPLAVECVQVVSIAGLGTDDWRVGASLPFPPGPTSPQGRTLYARTNAPRVTAVWRIMNAGAWSPLFRQCFEVKLAAALAPGLAREPGRGDDLKAELRAILMAAKRRDAQEAARRQVPAAGSWLDARYGRRRP